MKRTAIKMVIIVLALFAGQVAFAMVIGSQAIPTISPSPTVSSLQEPDPYEQYLSINVIESSPDNLEVEAVVDLSPLTDPYELRFVVLTIYHDRTILARVVLAYPPLDPEHVYRVSASIDPDVGETYGIQAYYVVVISGQGHNPSKTVEVTIEEADPCSLLEDLRALVEEATCWTKKNRQATMLNKINETIALCGAGEYEELADKLVHDIQPKLTGVKDEFGNGAFANAWVTCDNEALYDAIQAVLELLVAEPPVPQ